MDAVVRLHQAKAGGRVRARAWISRAHHQPVVEARRLPLAAAVAAARRLNRTRFLGP